MAYRKLLACFLALSLAGPEIDTIKAAGADQAPQIQHAPLLCMEPASFPEVDARVTSPSSIARTRIYFKAHQFPDWYYVEMKTAAADRYVAMLPQPMAGTTHIDYYVYALDSQFQTGQTDQYMPSVAKDRCVFAGPKPGDKSNKAKANQNPQIIVGGTKEGQPPIPPGFSKVGIIAFITIAGATIAGAALAGGSATAVGGAGAAAGAGAGGAATGGISALTVAAVVGGAALVAGGAIAVAGKGGSNPSGPDVQLSTTSTTMTTSTTTTTTSTTVPNTVDRFNGSYTGSFSGTFEGVPVNGPVAFTISNGNINVTQPGSGGGSVDASGSASFSGRLDVGGGVNCNFRGTFQTQGAGASANGTWSCSGAGTGSGTWNAQS